MAITNISLDNTTIIEGSSNGTLVGNISVIGDFTDIPVVSIENNNQFSVITETNGTSTTYKLVVLDGTLLDFEEHPTVDILLKAYTRKNIIEISKSGSYSVITTPTDHNLEVGDSITITSTLNCNGTFIVTDIIHATRFYVNFIPTYKDIETYGYAYTDIYTELPITISITDSLLSQTQVDSISPVSTKIQTHPEITITGSRFTEGGVPRVIINNTEQTLTSYTDTQIVFTLLDELEFGVYDVTVINQYEFNKLTSDPLYDYTPAILKLIIYVNDKAVSYTIGNNNCYVKPTMQLVYDSDGASGKYGSIMNVIPPNVNMKYINIYLKHNSDFDISVGGEVILDSVSLKSGDLVWLSNQTHNTNENGIYTVTTGAWTLYTQVTSDMFIDLGARATDQVDGDISRQIIIDENIKFGKSGFYSITYYIINSLGILSKTTRKVKILANGASISSSDAYKITDYLIRSEADSSLLLNGVYSSDNSESACCNKSGTSTEYINKNGTVKFTANQSMNNFRLTDLGDPINPMDAVNLRTVTNLISLTNAITTSHIAGEHIFIFQVVYIGTNGKIYVADTTDIDQMGKVIGIAIEDKNTNDSIKIVSSGKLSGLNSLTVGTNYYIASNGGLTYIPPTTNGFIQIMGMAISPSEFLLLMQPPIGIGE